MIGRKVVFVSGLLAVLAACMQDSTGTSSGSGGITSFRNVVGDTCYRDDRLPARATLPNGMVVTNEFCELQYRIVSAGLQNGDLERKARNSPAPSDTEQYLGLARTFVGSFEDQDLDRSMRAARALTSVEAAWLLGRSGFSGPPSATPSRGSTTGPLGHCLYVAERSAAGTNYGISSSCIDTVEQRSRNRYPRQLWCDLEGGRNLGSNTPGSAVFTLVTSMQDNCFSCGVSGARHQLSNCRHYCDAHSCP